MERSGSTASKAWYTLTAQHSTMMRESAMTANLTRAPLRDAPRWITIPP